MLCYVFIMLCFDYVMLYYVMSCYDIVYCIMLCHVMICYVKLCFYYLMFYYVMSCYDIVYCIYCEDPTPQIIDPRFIGVLRFCKIE